AIDAIARRQDLAVVRGAIGPRRPAAGELRQQVSTRLAAVDVMLDADHAIRRQPPVEEQRDRGLLETARHLVAHHRLLAHRRLLAHDRMLAMVEPTTTELLFAGFVREVPVDAAHGHELSAALADAWARATRAWPGLIVDPARYAAAIASGVCDADDPI